ncbi:transcriptional regulator [Amycolatopsis sp. NBRC 101858]|uniref:IclR family transcriptional regulator n=1 Tax=Amycolatopsis sp. NBRC 101858 TaxID=3032200 RepID=UPI0024A5E9FA|nr:IclR family transcriptional regulator [Amycolatopsis sp. NBRC 101858]GLY38961.1 transcriptional regulator [Amycolatopsis sp. NBRC 101858]
MSSRVTNSWSGLREAAESAGDNDQHEPRSKRDSAAERTVMGRIASIMEAFDGGPRVLTLGALSERTGLPKSTLHRLADQLRGVGWVERESGGYRIGMRLFELGSLALGGNRLPDAALPHLQVLAARTGLSAQLAVLDHTDVVYLERIVTGPVPLPTRRGGRKPAYCTALGKAMVAFDDDATQEVISARMPRKTRHTITEPDLLWTELGKVRETGVALDRGEAYADLVCVAAPIRSSGRAIGAVSVTGPAGRMRWSAATDAVRSAAAAIWNANFSVGAGGQA